MSGAVQSPVIDETVPVDVPPPTEKALDYYRTGNWLWAADQVWSFATLLVILGTGFSARLREWSMRIGRNWFFTVAVYWVLFTLLVGVPYAALIIATVRDGDATRGPDSV